MNRTCNTCNKEKDKNNYYLKDGTVWKRCYNKNGRKNNINTLIQNQEPKTENVNNNKNNVNNPNVLTYENHAYVVIGPRNLGKIYHMLKKLEKIGNKRPIHLITRSPNQYPIYKTSNEIKPKKNCKGSVVISDDMLGARNSSQINDFYTRGRHENLEVSYIRQSYFGLPRQNIRNNCDRLILFKQTLGDVQTMFYDIGAYEMKYDDLKEMCQEAWSEGYNYLDVDMAKNKNEGKYRLFNECKTTYFDCVPESEPF